MAAKKNLSVPDETLFYCQKKFCTFQLTKLSTKDFSAKMILHSSKFTLNRWHCVVSEQSSEKFRPQISFDNRFQFSQGHRYYSEKVLKGTNATVLEDMYNKWKVEKSSVHPVYSD